jgi:hypothetical protein
VLVTPYGCLADFLRTEPHLRHSPGCSHLAPLGAGRSAPHADQFVIGQCCFDALRPDRTAEANPMSEHRSSDSDAHHSLRFKSW